MKVLLMSGLTLSIGLITQSPAVHATKGYQPIKSKSYATILPTYHTRVGNPKAAIWNNNLTQKRFSLSDYPGTNWYVFKSYKMTNGKKTGIFYRIKNPENTVSGLVWRGYLKQVKHLSIKQQTLNALPGTIYSPHLQQVTDKLKNHPDSQQEYLQKALGDQYKKFQGITIPGFLASDKRLQGQLKSGKLSFNAYLHAVIPKALLTDLNGNNYQVTNLKGWKVSISISGKTSKNYGWGFVYFLEP